MLAARGVAINPPNPTAEHQSSVAPRARPSFTSLRPALVVGSGESSSLYISLEHDCTPSPALSRVCSALATKGVLTARVLVAGRCHPSVPDDLRQPCEPPRDLGTRGNAPEYRSALATTIDARSRAPHLVVHAPTRKTRVRCPFGRWQSLSRNCQQGTREATSTVSAVGVCCLGDR